MNFNIFLDGTPNEETSYDLERLATLISRECSCSLTIGREQAKAGVKDDGLILGISIASLVFSAVQSLFAALQYWESQNSKYIITINFMNETLIIEHNSRDDFEKELRSIYSKHPDANLEIKIIEKSH